MRFLLTVWFLAINILSSGQTTVLKMPKSVLDADYTYGKNNKHYVHTGFSFYTGLLASDLPNLIFRPQTSSSFYFFILYKRKLNNIFSLTSEFNVGSSWIYYRFTDDSPQYPAIFSTHTRDMITTGEIEMHQNLRFRISGAPNRIGNYIEFGVIGGLTTSRRYTHRGTSTANQKTELSFINDPVILTDGNQYKLNLFYYGFKARVGFNRLSIPVRYTQNGDFWWLMTGIELGLF